MISTLCRARAALALFALAALAFQPAALALQPAALALQNDDTPHFARATRDDAALRNLADKNGHKVLGLAAGSLLEIHGERADFYEVSIPGGVPVWVFGRYVKPAGDEGVYEITADSVNARPRAAGGTDNYPLGRLYSGDLVVAIRRNNESLALEADWLQVWAPDTVHAWIRKGDVNELAAGEDGAALWAAALVTLAESDDTRTVSASSSKPNPSNPNSTSGATGAAADSAGNAAAETAALAQLAAAQTLFEAEKAKEWPNFEAVREAFEEVPRLNPSGDAARRASDRLVTLAALEDIVQVQAELKQVRNEHDKAVVERQDKAWEAGKRKDPLGQRFDGRGVLERRQVAGQAPRYVLHFGGEDLCEVLCSAGRYDLDLFSGYDVGLSGSFLRTVEAAAGRDVLPIIDSDKIRVLARR